MGPPPDAPVLDDEVHQRQGRPVGVAHGHVQRQLARVLPGGWESTAEPGDPPQPGGAPGDGDEPRTLPAWGSPGPRGSPGAWPNRALRRRPAAAPAGRGCGWRPRGGGARRGRPAARSAAPCTWPRCTPCVRSCGAGGISGQPRTSPPSRSRIRRGSSARGAGPDVLAMTPGAPSPRAGDNGDTEPPTPAGSVPPRQCRTHISLPAEGLGQSCVGSVASMISLKRVFPTLTASCGERGRGR